MWLQSSCFPFCIRKFLLTHPVWDVTVERRKKFCETRFLLTHPVWDVTKFQNFLDRIAYNFYSHIPCGMWPSNLWASHFVLISTHTSRVGCDNSCLSLNAIDGISTHTSRVGCDPLRRLNLQSHTYFYSHIPCGMWRISGRVLIALLNFYSHIPCGMWLTHSCIITTYTNFYSHIPCGMWLNQMLQSEHRSKFLLTHPVWDVTIFSISLHLPIKFLLTHPVWDVT